jgi:hypothetical protein
MSKTYIPNYFKRSFPWKTWFLKIFNISTNNIIYVEATTLIFCNFLNNICSRVFVTLRNRHNSHTLAHIRRYACIDKGWALRLSYPKIQTKKKSYKYTFTLCFFRRSFISFILQKI